ncbi:monalysin family beta-barrel pore-forming toxin [Archangium violaceum]|uniref:monalysin family beta-barrel pore-forming toxin n=1 Tax=Archangium violaceum TaxID=83451 RepID=UPI0036D953FD
MENPTPASDGQPKFRRMKDFLEHERSAIVPAGTDRSNLVAATYPWATGDFGIDQYLKTLNPLPACWVNGETVYGDIYITSQNWGTYTRPIFAYLEFVDQYPVPNQVTLQHQVSKKSGFTQSFTKEVKSSYSVGAKIDIVNVGSNISTGFSATQSWSQEQSESWTTTLQGPGVFYTYQVALVYAHNATSAANKCGSNFKYKRTQQVGSRNDLYYLSSIHKGDMITLSTPITPLTWDQVQQYVLIDHWGEWYLDGSAYDDPFRRY